MDYLATCNTDEIMIGILEKCERKEKEKSCSDTQASDKSFQSCPKK